MPEIEAGYGQVTHHFIGGAVPLGAAVTYGIRNDSDISAVGCASLARAAVAGVVARLTDSVAMVRTSVKLGPNDTGSSGEHAGAAVNGASGTNAAPPNVAYLVTKVTLLGGRRGRGRMFFPGVEETGVNDGGLNDQAVIDAWTIALDDMLGLLAVSDIPMYLLHGPKTEWVLIQGQPRRVTVAGAIPTATIVESLIFDARVASQRDRNR